MFLLLIASQLLKEIRKDLRMFIKPLWILKIINEQYYLNLNLLFILQMIYSN